MTALVRLTATIWLAMVVLTSCGESTGSDPVAAGSHLAGSVLAGPTCPVERAESPCPPQPVAAVLVELLRGDQVVASGRTDGDGAFGFDAPTGYFVVRVRSGDGYPSEATKPVDLAAGHTTTVTLMLDTGIR